ncbi:MAG TPA: spore germination protein GerW family protein [Actinomycetota bacterium]
MELEEMMKGARDAITVGRVYGEPFEKNGVTILPAASVRGGGGGGSGESPQGEGKGTGGGFGVTARPVGAYVIRGEDVRWEPAVDVTRMALMAQAVGLVALLVIRSIVKSRAKAKARIAKAES